MTNPQAIFSIIGNRCSPSPPSDIKVIPFERLLLNSFIFLRQAVLALSRDMNQMAHIAQWPHIRQICLASVFGISPNFLATIIILTLTCYVYPLSFLASRISFSNLHLLKVYGTCHIIKDIKSTILLEILLSLPFLVHSIKDRLSLSMIALTQLINFPFHFLV